MFQSVKQWVQAYSEWLFLTLIVLSGLVFRLGYLNRVVAHDEAYTFIAFANRSWLGAISDYSLPNNHIFHTILVKISILILGNHPWSLRLPALLAGLAVIVAVYFVGKKMYSPATGLVAAVLMAYAEEAVQFMTDARGYSLVALFCLLAVLAVIQVLKENSIKGWAALSIFSALGLYTVPIMFLPATAIYAWVFLEGLTQKSWQFYKRWLISGLGVGLLTILLYTPVFIFTGWRSLISNRFIQPVLDSNYFSNYLVLRVTLLLQEWHANLPEWLMVFILICFVISVLFHRFFSNFRFSFPALLVVWVGLYFLISEQNIHARFLSFAMPFFFLGAAGGLTELLNKILIKGHRFGRFFSYGLIVLLLFASLAELPSVPDKFNKLNNPEAVANSIAKKLEAKDTIAIGPSINATLWYYLSRAGVDESVWQLNQPFNRVFLVVAPNFGESFNSVLKFSKIDPAILDLNSAEVVIKYGTIQVYLINSLK